MTNLSELRLRLVNQSRQIAVIQTAFLGDAILTIPLLRAIKRAFPSSRTLIVCRSDTADIFTGWADEIIGLNKQDRPSINRQTTALSDYFKTSKIDIAFIPHRSWRSGWMARQGDIAVRIGFNRGGGRWLHTHRVHYQWNQYEGLRNLSLLQSVAETADDGLPQLILSEDDHQLIESLLSTLNLEPFRYIVCAPGSVWQTKKWLITHWKSLIQLLADLSYPVLLIGGIGDRNLCGELAGRSEFNFAGALSVLQSAALMERARLVISGDTAPAHLATAVSARQLIIFGSTAPRFGFAPPVATCRTVGLDLWCRPCTDHGRRMCPLGNLKCLTEIAPEMVIKVISDWL